MGPMGILEDPPSFGWKWLQMMLPETSNKLFVILFFEFPAVFFFFRTDVAASCLRSPLPQDLWLRRHFLRRINRILPRCDVNLSWQNALTISLKGWCRPGDFQVKSLILYRSEVIKFLISGRIIKCTNVCQLWVICWYAVDSAVFFRFGKTKLYRCILRRHKEWRMRWIKSLFYKFQTFSTSSRSNFVHIERFSFDLEDSSIFITWEDEQYARKQTYLYNLS